MWIRTSVRVVVFVLVAATASAIVFAQTREKGPWWPSPHGVNDQAGNSNYITAEKILKALRIPKTGQTYELGRIYEAEMPQYGYRPYFLTIIQAAARKSEREWHSRTTSPDSSARWERSSMRLVIRVRSSGWPTAR